MKALAKFRQEIKEAGPKSGLWAYRMDGEDGFYGMAEDADLLNCNCCDYFRAVDGAPILIEVTRLMAWKEEKEKEYAHLGALAGKHVWKLAKQENRLKVYGGMLTLCRHARRSGEVAKALDEGEYKFWLVVHDGAGPQVGKVFRNLCADLRQELCHGPRRKKMLAAVEVFGITHLRKKLPSD